MDALVPLTKLALFAVIVVFILGMGSLALGHDDAADMVRANKLMRLRVEIQAIALGLILLAFLIAAL